MTPPIPQELVDAIANDDAVLFVGAGLSSGAGVPTWAELVLPLAESMHLPAERRTNLLQVAQDYENDKGRHALAQHIVNKTDTTGKPPTANHHRLAKLPIQTWITTNYDDLLEQTLTDARLRRRKVVRDQDLPYTSAEQVTVLKLHGDREQPDTIVITQEDYDTFFDRFPLIATKLAALLLDKTFFFVGYSIRDPDFNQLRTRIAYKLKEHQRRAYSVLFNVDDYSAKDLRQRQIEVLNLTLNKGQDPSQALGEILDELIQQVQAKAMAQSVVVRTAPSVAATQDLHDYLARAVERYERRMDRALRQRSSPTEPYRGLLPYQFEDRSIFFGRDVAIEALHNAIFMDRLTVMQARSGAGKTSILNAGLAPRLIDGDRLSVYARPYEDPTLAIKRALASPAEEPWPELLASLSLPEFLGLVCARLSRQTRELVLILDQFEEFFVFWPLREQRQPFIDALAECYHDHGLPVRIVLVIRKDYFGDLQELRGPLPSVFQNIYHLDPMTRQEAEAAITGPVRALSKPTQYEPVLLNALLDDLALGGMELPHLQIICERLYRSLPDGETIITLKSYHALGEARGVLGRYLRDVMEQLSGHDAQLARQVLKALVSSESTRWVRSEKDLASAVQAERTSLAKILDWLVRDRVLQRDEVDDDIRYQLAHEYLIQEVSKWLDMEDLAVKQAQELLQRQLASWMQNKELLIPEVALRMISKQRDALRTMSPTELELIFRSTLKETYEVSYWFEQARLGGVAVDAITREGLTSDSFRTRAAAIKALAELGHAFVDDILAGLADAYPQVRVAAMAALEILRPGGAWRKHLKYECYVPEGEFVMGDNSGDADETPAHKVYLDAFYVGKYSVTNAEYACFMADRPRGFDMPAGKENHPVVNVSWYDAKEYADWAGMRLLTEAEWEKAASWEEVDKEIAQHTEVNAERASREENKGPKRKYPWGDTFDKTKCNTKESGIGMTRPVGKYSPVGDSSFGAADLAGNVWEWTSSKYNSYPYSADYDRENLTNYAHRVLRGGSWDDVAFSARCAARFVDEPNYRYDFRGFRVGWTSSSASGHSTPLRSGTS